MTWWNLGVAGVLFICYLIYAIKNKEFLAFTLSKKYFLSLFLGMFLGMFLSVFLGSLLSAGDRMLKFILYYLGESIVFAITFSPLFAITFSVIFSIAKKIRNVKNIEIETNNKFFNINLRFILLVCLFLFFITEPHFWFGIILFVGSLL
ncbi:hypothetical protein MKD52_08000 [Helicobacter sp. CaF467b]|uniref:hypothetical protein n=1 Tax=Helicobacter sp. CaF467b TaxID=2919923 RepID=UPI001F580C6F|nr:hypothetical protein [Helicobacter sp. CaF467b]MCI2236767.1 hypothetical protein [Helicobacter sp. CaF467b]